MSEDIVLVEIISDRSAKIIEQKYSNLLAVWDAGLVFSAIASYLRLNGIPKGDEFTVPNLVASTEEALRKLIKRKALDGYQRIPSPIPEAAQHELDLLFGVEPELSNPAADAQAAHAALVTQCASDYLSRPSREFKAKWMGSPDRSVYEEALLKIEADDRARASQATQAREAREGSAREQFNNRPLSTSDF